MYQYRITQHAEEIKSPSSVNRLYGLSQEEQAAQIKKIAYYAFTLLSK